MALEQAVVLILQDFVAATKSFSAHEVTVELRNRINKGDYEIIGLPKITHPSGTGETQNVGHSEVRNIVHEEVDNYVSEHYNPVRKSGAKGHYVSYEYQAPGTTPVMSTASTGPTAAVLAPAIGTPVVVAPIPSARVVPSSVLKAHKPFGPTEEARCLTYVVNRQSEGLNPTLKAIQSRLKDIDVTCDHLATFLLGKGYTLHQPISGSPDSGRTVLPKT